MRILITAMAIATFAQSTSAQLIAPMPSAGAQRPQNDQQLLYTYRAKLKPLREEILARKAIEGGELSEASKAEFQGRLDTLNRQFRRYVKKQDVYGYDAWGDREG